MALKKAIWVSEKNYGMLFEMAGKIQSKLKRRITPNDIITDLWEHLNCLAKEKK